MPERGVQAALVKLPQKTQQAIKKYALFKSCLCSEPNRVWQPAALLRTKKEHLSIQ
ncbi:MAG: hypothetical protein WBN40_00310 [Pseudomonadales bacterium]